MSGQVTRFLIAVVFVIGMSFPGASSAHAIEGSRANCSESRELVGACYTVHGALFTANGSPGLRIWVVGSKRILGIHNDDPTDGEPAGYPTCLLPHIGFGKRLYADFVVCPFTPDQQGSMRRVCVESATHMVVEDYTGLGPTESVPRLYKVAGTCAMP